jgi:hypothetical protein
MSAFCGTLSNAVGTNSTRKHTIPKTVNCGKSISVIKRINHNKQGETDDFLKGIDRQVMEQIAKENNWPEEPQQPPAPEASAPSVEQPAASLPANPHEGRVMKPYEFVQADDWCVDHEGETHRPSARNVVGKLVGDLIGNAVKEWRTFRPAAQPAPSVKQPAKPVPSVNLVRHEVEELRRANAALLESNKILTGLSKTHRAERDQLAASLAKMTEDRDALRIKERERTQALLASIEECEKLDAQLAALKSTPATQPEPVKWRELTKNDQYSGPGQVTDDAPEDGEQEWFDAVIMGIDPNCNYPFVAKRNQYNAYCGFEFARVRDDAGRG